MTDSNGVPISTIVFDPWGGAMSSPWTQNPGQQNRRFTTYERDANESDEAMMRRYNRWHSRFDQPDPYDGSYSLTDPQSFNRYAYVQNDPVNFVDPSGLQAQGGGGSGGGGFDFQITWWRNPDGSIGTSFGIGAGNSSDSIRRLISGGGAGGGDHHGASRGEQ